MPKFPQLSTRLEQLPASVFEKFLPRMREKGDSLVKLHIGDSYLPPPYSLPVDREFTKTRPDFNRYCDTMGIPQLRTVLAKKVSADNQLNAAPDNIMMTCGASNALNVSTMSLIEPGEEVMVLTPCWPFFPGMVKIAGGHPVEVPFYTTLYERPALDIEDYLQGYLTPGMVALYLNTPNNPSGKVLHRQQLEQVAAFVKKHRLWLISDEAYDGMTYDNRPHVSIGSFPGMFSQTLSIFTFSKVYMFAGLRLGYLVAEAGILRNFNKMLVHQLYSPSPLAQYMMIEPVNTRGTWGKGFVEHCHELRELFVRQLQVSLHVPEGAYYLFFSLKNLLGDRNYWEVIEELLETGVSVAPGKDFGRDFSSYIRICFAGEAPDRLKIAVDRLNRILSGRG